MQPACWVSTNRVEPQINFNFLVNINASSTCMHNKKLHKRWLETADTIAWRSTSDATNKQAKATTVIALTSKISRFFRTVCDSRQWHVLLEKKQPRTCVRKFFLFQRWLPTGLSIARTKKVLATSQNDLYTKIHHYFPVASLVMSHVTNGMQCRTRRGN